MNKLKNLLLSGSAVLLLAACGTDTTGDDEVVDGLIDDAEEVAEDADDKLNKLAEDMAETDETFTLDELSEFNGEDGNPAYVAVDGIVYDVTGIEAWAGGEHAGTLTAGNDYTEEIMESEHGTTVLKDLDKVGTLVDE